MRLGLLLMLWSVPMLAGAVVRYVGWGGVGVPLTTLNLPAPKIWGVPLAWVSHGSGELVAAFILLNTIGGWLLTAPHEPAMARERSLSLRRCLRVYVIIAVTFLWMVMSPRNGWLHLPELFHPLATVLLVELPGTAMLYLYLAQLSDQRLRDPSFKRRAQRVLYGSASLQIVSMILFLRILPLDGLVLDALLGAYLIAAVGLGLYAVDFILDFYRAFTPQTLH